ncbi:ribosomal protein S13 component of cytosolic 80S ribosome and 40S small subunit [Haematococcus lacustris]
MGRMHSKGKGMSSSALPYKRSPPSWCKTTATEVTDQICKLARKGMTPSQIGVILRDSNGIPQVNSVTGSKILRILKGHGLAPEIPEDLYHLIKKICATAAPTARAARTLVTDIGVVTLCAHAVSVRKHLERSRKDKDGKFRLILVESRIHRLARYYKRARKLPPNWKYESATASTMVS